MSEKKEYIVKYSSHYAANSNRSRFKQMLVSHCMIQSIMLKKQRHLQQKREKYALGMLINL